MPHAPQRTALILGDGGACAAYHVGVLKAVKELLPQPRTNPFPILCGTSGGALNAGILAASAEDFGAGVEKLDAFWSSLRIDDVYRADVFRVAGAGMRWLSAFATGWIVPQRPRSLLDNAPLRRVIEASVDFSRIETAIRRHALLAVGITSSGYDSGQSVTFFQGRADLDPWRRPQRVAAHVKLNADHLLASMAIPFVFPAVRMHREWFGDGAMRQFAPLSPAIHLGAERILVVGAGSSASERESPLARTYPAPARIAGQQLSTFADSLGADLENATRINRELALIPEETKRAHGLRLRHVEFLHIAPSRRLDMLAARHADSLPRAVKALLRSLGSLDEGGALAGSLLFGQSFIQALINLGYADASEHRDEIRAFLA